MAKVYVFLATGFEETEMITPVDLLRRAGIDTCIVSIMGELTVMGRSNISVMADKLYEQVDFSDGDLLLLPGGQPGTNNLLNYAPLQTLIKEWNEDGKRLAAICAAPMVFGELGLLVGKKATCYPGCEERLRGAIKTIEKVVTDGNITTSRGLGTAILFGLEIIKLLVDEECAKNIASEVIYQ